MKKVFSFILTFIILGFLLQLVFTFLKKEHQIDYTLFTNDKEVKVHEEYRKQETEDYYIVNLDVLDYHFSFTVDNFFGKQKEILKEVLFYEKDNLFCAYPVYIKQKTGNEFLCDYDGKQYSYYALKDKFDFNEYIKMLPNFTILDKNSNESSSIFDFSFYQSNFMEKEHIYLYNYQELIDLGPEIINEIRFSDHDIYTNEYGVIINDFFVIPDYTTKGYFDRFKLVNIYNNKTIYMDLEESISTDFYINGILDNKIYLFDRSSKKQYLVDVINKETTIVGDEEKNALVYKNGKFEEVSVYDLVKEEITFTEDLSEIQEYSYVLAVKTGKYYYFYDKDGNVYRYTIGAKGSLVYLFQMKEIENFKVVHDAIYFTSGTKLYRYYQNTLSVLVERKEFQYNNYRIYEVVFE